jgi:hypothetical protein
VLELQPYAQGAGPSGEDLQQAVAADAEALVTGAPGDQVAHPGLALVPGDRGLLDRTGRLGVVRVEFVEQSAPVGDAPAVGRALRIALVDRDVVGRVLPFQQDREIQAGGPAADAGDLHTHP